MSDKKEIVKISDGVESIMADLVLHNDVGALDDRQKVAYYRAVCESVGVNPVLQPFQILRLNGREVLYATKSCTEQLRCARGISIISCVGERMDGIYRVAVVVQEAAGRKDVATGVVSIAGLKGDSLANALMKAETKAKRRATLSICGLGMLDESEIETIPGAVQVSMDRPAESTTVSARVVDAAPNTDRIARIMQAFESVGVSRERLEKFLTHSLDTASDEEIKNLRSIYDEIRHGADARDQLGEMSDAAE